MSCKKYQVTAPFGVTLHIGKLRLTPDQHQARQHQLTATNKKGEYLIAQPVTFKCGETIDFDGDIPKSHASDLDVVERDKATASKAKADADKAAQAAQREKVVSDLNTAITAATDTIAALLAEQESAATPEAKAELDKPLAKARKQLAEAKYDLNELGN